MPGRATCASCATRCSARRCWRAATHRRRDLDLPQQCARRQRRRQWRRTDRASIEAALAQRRRVGAGRCRAWLVAAGAVPPARPARHRAAAFDARPPGPGRWYADDRHRGRRHRCDRGPRLRCCCAWLQPWAAALVASLVVGTIVATVIWRALVPMRALFRAPGRHRGELPRRRLQLRHHLGGGRRPGIELGRAQRARQRACANNAPRAGAARTAALTTMVQNTPVAMVLIDAGAAWCSGNPPRGACSTKAAGLEGRAFDDMLHRRSGGARRSNVAATACSPSAMPTTRTSTTLSRRGSFRLNGRIHELVLLRQLTAELRRQERRPGRR